tara:strand:+ start:4498 stop:4758 length:261 start_codon:yes stop_codon:yes gene_type:complete
MVRLFHPEEGWTDISRRCVNEVALMLEDVLKKLETETQAPVDLRDFHFVANHALGGFVADLSIRRRLGQGDEGPRPIIGDYPRLDS